MPSRSIRWSLRSLGSLLLTTPLWAVDDSPDIAAADDPLALEFEHQFDERLLLKEAASAELPRDYLPVVAGPDEVLPDVVVLPSEKYLPTPAIIPAGKPAAVTHAPPEWVLFQPAERPLEREWLLLQAAITRAVAEEQVLARIDFEYGSSTSEIDELELPAWPQEEPPSRPSFEIFDAELISPFSPIPELDALPFPDA